MKETNEEININFESHIKIIDVTDIDNPKKILSARLFNNFNRVNNKQDDNLKKGT